MIRWIVVVSFVLHMMQAALAQAPAQQGAGGIPAGLAQKQAFARSMIEDASTAERVKASQDVEALSFFTLAKDAYNRALAINPQYVEAFYNRALVYFVIKQYNRSQDDLRQAAALGTKSPPEFLEALKNGLAQQS